MRSRWLGEDRRGYTALIITFVFLAGALPLTRTVAPEGLRPAEIEVALMAMAVYLVSYVVLTTVIFVRVPAAVALAWARRSEPGTWVQHIVLATKPGAGVATVVSAVALMAGVFWLPQPDPSSELSATARGVLAVVLVVAAWLTVALTYSVAYLCLDARSRHRMLAFPGEGERSWTDYLYFAIIVNTTFAGSDVAVLHPRMRRTVAVHGVVAFVFNTVVLAAVVSVLLR